MTRQPDADRPAPDELVAVGRVGAPRGIRGEVYVVPLTDAPAERFVEGTVLHTDPPEAGPLTIEYCTLAGGRLVVRFSGRADREAVEAIHRVELLMRAADRPALEDPDEYYDTDLIGLRATAPDGTDIGPVVAVVHAAGVDQLAVEVDGQERLIPFVAAIVPLVDIAGGRVVVTAPDGLFEL